jgi:hypothetical protein
MELKKKTILIISPQNWGELYISKHHYAIELIKQGNTVYFLNLPSRNSSLFKKTEVLAYPGLFVIDYYPIFRGKNALPKWGFEWLTQLQIKWLQFRIGQPIDVVWSFTSKFHYNLNWFRRKALKIFHLVDNENTGNEEVTASSADLIFTVSKKLSDSLGQSGKNAVVINHGIAQYEDRTVEPYQKPNQLTFGYVGNLQNTFVDRQNLLKLVRANTAVQFNFIGPVNKEGNNLQGVFDEHFKQFIHQLNELPNCTLKGKIPSAALFQEIRNYDGFIVVYDPQRLSAVGGNSHKIVEFLHTGKVIVSNFIDEYANTSLFAMSNDVNNNDAIHALFKDVVDNIRIHNAVEEQQKRLDFAKNNTYRAHLQTIGELVKQVSHKH